MAAPVIACEDTRRTGQLVKILRERYASFLNTSPYTTQVRYISIRDWNEANTVELIITELGKNDVVLVSDAGTPLISDPGYKLVRRAREVGIRVVPIPGANAAIAALSAAGLPTDKFVFLGFNWKKNLVLGMTNIIYESPLRAEKAVNEIKQKYPGSEIITASELTKLHEYIGPEVKTTKGEVTLLAYIRDEVAAHHGNGNGDLHKGENSGGDIS